MVYLRPPGPVPKPAKPVRDRKLLRDIHSVRPHCQRCKARATGTHRLNRLHVAHIVSRGRGGGDTFENVLILCCHCHMVEDHDRGNLSDEDKRELKAADERTFGFEYAELELEAFGRERWAGSRGGHDTLY